MIPNDSLLKTTYSFSFDSIAKALTVLTLPIASSATAVALETCQKTKPNTIEINLLHSIQTTYYKHTI